jgi:protein TonB
MSTLDSHARDDRLVYTLFAAALLHGLVILGITFESGSAPETPPTPLRVVMVESSQEQMTPEERAIFLSAEDRRGAGTLRAQTSGGMITPATPFDATGHRDGDDAEERDAAEAAVPQQTLVSPADASREVQAPPDASTQPDRTTLAARIQFASPQSTFQRRDRLEAQAEERELEISVATRRADVADYVARWKTRIEEVGTLYFPDAARQQGLAGSPLLEVAISADGGLRSIDVVRPSPHPLLDEAALRILRLAAPFEPFPEALRREYDSLRFVYEWRFLGGSTAAR